MGWNVSISDETVTQHTASSQPKVDNPGLRRFSKAIIGCVKWTKLTHLRVVNRMDNKLGLLNHHCYLSQLVTNLLNCEVFQKLCH